ncbi:MAG: Na(+)-translocating NADH-quinone reductase subunit C [Phycisphaerae bacterium]|nr:Na(+)-translocating NADH-quinone reductase subunit C [Phycisphaerae bacterium]
MSQQRNTTLYTIGFTAAVCVVCSLIVSTTAVSLKPRQASNALLDRQKNIIQVAGLIEPGTDPDREAIQHLFDQYMDPVVIELATGTEVDIDALTFDQTEAARDPARSRDAPPNPAGVKRVPIHGIVYRVVKDGTIDKLILPIEGKGLWSTLYGFIALDGDARTIRGITFYQHGETPGLGGEVDNPGWKARWKARKAFDERGNVTIEVLKKEAGPPEDDPYHVDGLSGATITSRGVSALVRFWLGDNGYKPYIERYNASRSQ